MNHCVKLICVASLSALSLFSCSTYKDKNCSSIDSQSYKEMRERESLPDFKDLPAVQLSLSLDADTAEYRADSSLDVEPLCANTEKCSLDSSHSSTVVEEDSSKDSYSSTCVEEYFNLPSPTVDTSKYKTVCEGDNPPLYGGNQSSQTDNPSLVNTPIPPDKALDKDINKNVNSIQISETIPNSSNNKPEEDNNQDLDTVISDNSNQNNNNFVEEEKILPNEIEEENHGPNKIDLSTISEESSHLIIQIVMLLLASVTCLFIVIKKIRQHDSK